MEEIRAIRPAIITPLIPPHHDDEGGIVGCDRDSYLISIDY